MSASNLPDHKERERVTLRWPGGFYDFVIEFSSIDQDRADPKWWWIRGLVVSPEGPEHRASRTFMVRRVDGEWALLPYAS